MTPKCNCTTGRKLVEVPQADDLCLLCEHYVVWETERLIKEEEEVLYTVHLPAHEKLD